MVYNDSSELARAMNGAQVTTENYLNTMQSFWDEGLDTWSVGVQGGLFVLAFQEDIRKWLCVYSADSGSWIKPLSDMPGSKIVDGYANSGRQVRDFVQQIVDGCEPYANTTEVTEYLEDEDPMHSFSRALEAEAAKTVVADDMASFDGGGVRASEDGKPDFTLLWAKGVPYEEQFLYKLAMHMTEGAKKYESRNWEKFHTPEALDRAMRSKARHHSQDQAGETDEPHNIAEAANCMFVHTISWKIENGWTPDE